MLDKSDPMHVDITELNDKAARIATLHAVVSQKDISNMRVIWRLFNNVEWYSLVSKTDISQEELDKVVSKYQRALLGMDESK